MKKHFHVFGKQGFCSCGIFKGLSRRQSNRFAEGLNCFSVKVFDAEFDKLNRLHQKAMGKKTSNKKWFDLEVKSFKEGIRIGD